MTSKLHFALADAIRRRNEVGSSSGWTSVRRDKNISGPKFRIADKYVRVQSSVSKHLHVHPVAGALCLLRGEFGVAHSRSRQRQRRGRCLAFKDAYFGSYIAWDTSLNPVAGFTRSSTRKPRQLQERELTRKMRFGSVLTLYTAVKGASGLSLASSSDAGLQEACTRLGMGRTRS